MGEPTSVSLVRTNPSVFNPKNPRGSLSTVIYIFVRITGALMEVKEMENELAVCINENKPIIFFDPIIGKFWMSNMNAIKKGILFMRSEAYEAAIKEREANMETSEECNYWLRCLHAENSHLEDPFLERLYSMKGLVV